MLLKVPSTHPTNTASHRDPHLLSYNKKRREKIKNCKPEHTQASSHFINGTVLCNLVLKNSENRKCAVCNLMIRCNDTADIEQHAVSKQLWLGYIS
jgi:hypothetical protein